MMMQLKVLRKGLVLEVMNLNFPSGFSEKQKGGHLKKMIEELQLKYTDKNRKSAAKPAFLIDGLPPAKSSFATALATPDVSLL